MLPSIDSARQTLLSRDSNQALGIGRFAVDFMAKANPAASVLERTNLFNTDAMMCGISALALGTNAPTILREEALVYQCTKGGVPVLASKAACHVEKAILANSAAVREWDSNGTNFGYNARLGHTAGEFGHNDYYPVAIAAAQQMGKDGAFALRGMMLLDEVRGRLAEVFSLKTYKIDHVLHGAIGSAAAYGAMTGATAEQIESAIGMVVAHYVPFRAIRYGKQLSDSKGASAAISTEAAILAMKRSMKGFIGPKDIFRNAEAVFCLFEKPKNKGEAPFDLVLSHAGDDFAVMGMHFKLGLYEHQSAGAIQSLLDLVEKHPGLLEGGGKKIGKIKVIAYEPAYHIIGDPAKRDPRTRQSADHSMVYILSTLLRKAIEQKTADWATLMLSPYDYDQKALMNPLTRDLMGRIEFQHGGAEYDAKYHEGIPSSVVITDDAGKQHDSGLCMFPTGHAKNTKADLKMLLAHKFKLLGSLASQEPEKLVNRFSALEKQSAAQVAALYDFAIEHKPGYE